MFDSYEPTAELGCPSCGQRLSGWQSKEGPCGLFVFREGARAPVAHAVDEAWRASDLSEIRLHEGVTGIYTSCDRCHRPVDALVFVADGVWTHTELESTVNAVQRIWESEHEFRVHEARLRELFERKPLGSLSADDE